jgi:hypothetical protein
MAQTGLNLALDRDKWRAVLITVMNPSGFVKYGKIAESLATSRTQVHSTESYPNFPLPGCCAPQNLPGVSQAFTAVPIGWFPYAFSTATNLSLFR